MTTSLIFRLPRLSPAAAVLRDNVAYSELFCSIETVQGVINFCYSRKWKSCSGLRPNAGFLISLKVEGSQWRYGLK